LWRRIVTSNDSKEPTLPVEKVVLREVVQLLVDYPDEVYIEEAISESSTHYVIHCADEDRGKVIGREGVAMNAIRTLFGRMAAVNGKLVYIHVDNGSFRSRAADNPAEKSV
jgi:predicted RNA-binding protein YlqC (UPF0109 family)